MPSYEIDAYSASKANMAMLPEMMQLGQLQQMRQGIEQNEFELRKMGREEDAVFQEADEFGQFEEVVRQTSGMSPVEQSQAIQKSLAENPAWRNNSKIKSNLSEIQQGRRDQIQAGLDELSLGNYETNKKLAAVNSRNALNEALEVEAKFKRASDEGRFKDSYNFGTYLGESGTILDIETKDKLVEVSSALGANPASSHLVEGLGKIVAGVSSANGLFSTLGEELSEYRPMLEVANNSGFSLSPDQTPEEFSASYDKAIAYSTDAKNGSNGAQMRKAAEIAKNVHAEYSLVSTFKDELKTSLQSLDVKDNEAVTNFVSKWNMRAAQIDGRTKKELARKDAAYKKYDADQKRQLQAAKLRTELIKPQNQQDQKVIAQAKLELQRDLFKLSESKAKVVLYNDLIESEAQVDGESFKSLSFERQKQEVDKLFTALGSADSNQGLNGPKLIE